MDALVNSEANARRIHIVEECFGNGTKLYNPGRVLIGEGVLTKQCRKKIKPRQFFLFNDILVYGDIVIHRKKYSKQHILSLNNIKLVDLEDEDRLQNGFQIITPLKSFAVYAASDTEKVEWMAHIQRCINSLRNKTDPTSSSDLAPVWISDDSAPFCMLCTKSKFTLINRRHHCRKCGAVVCGNCSQKKFTLPNQSEKPLRVCDTCFDSLTKPGEAGDSIADFRFPDRPDSPEDDDLYKVPKEVFSNSHNNSTQDAAPVGAEAPVIPVKKKIINHSAVISSQENENRYGSSDDEDDVDTHITIETTAPTFYSQDAHNFSDV